MSSGENLNNLRVIIAGGGTGGHIFPGLAIAGEFKNRHPGADIHFVTGGRTMDAEILDGTGFKRISITVEGIKGRGWKKGIRAISQLPMAFLQSISIIRGLSPHFVIGVGGYSSGPVCMAGWFMRKITAIHEQNSFPGLTNRILCRIVDRVFISFERSREFLSGGSIVLAGNPVRTEFFKNDKSVNKKDGFTLFISGGSQGAASINKAVTEALKIIPSEKRKGLTVIHQTGTSDYEEIAEEYRRNSLPGEIYSFIKDMHGAYMRTDLFIGRAGAGTIFELAATGTPSILIPYPHAANRHQEINARTMERLGGAKVILEENLSPEELAKILVEYMGDRKGLKGMGENARKLSSPDAAKKIVDHLEDLLREREEFKKNHPGDN